jgi:hypothetical protein
VASEWADIFEQAEHLAHLGIATEHVAEAFTRRRGDVDVLLVRQIFKQGLADLDLGPEAKQQFLKARAADERTIGRAEVTYDDTIRVKRDGQVSPRDGRVGQVHVARGSRPQRHGARAHDQGFAAIRTTNDSESPAPGLAKNRCVLGNQSGDRCRHAFHDEA